MGGLLPSDGKSPDLGAQVIDYNQRKYEIEIAEAGWCLNSANTNAEYCYPKP